jgi:hypothetical protein
VITQKKVAILYYCVGDMNGFHWIQYEGYPESNLGLGIKKPK